MLDTAGWQDRYAQSLGYDDAEQMYYEWQQEDYQEMQEKIDNMLKAYLKHKNKS